MTKKKKDIANNEKCRQNNIMQKRRGNKRKNTQIIKIKIFTSCAAHCEQAQLWLNSSLYPHRTQEISYSAAEGGFVPS
jgi:hypothetical protein